MGTWARAARGCALIGTAVFAVLPSCGGSGAGNCGEAPSVEPTTPLTQLTPAQLGELCDWASCTLGGYGTSHSCGGNTTVGAEPDQAACVDSLLNATCTATYADVTGCFGSLVGDPCALLTSSACTLFFECATP